MKSTNLLILFSGFFQFFGLSQGITISSTDLAAAPDTVRYSLANMNAPVDFSKTGTNINWDFTSLSAASQDLKYFAPMSEAPPFDQLTTFGFLAPKAYRATYFTEATNLPLADISKLLPLPVSFENIYQFTKKDTDSLTHVGYSMKLSSNGNSFDLSVRSDTIETNYRFPMKYGQSYNSRGYTKFDLNPVVNAIWIQTKSRNSLVDGYGTLKTPYGNFDALRVKHEISELDSIYAQFPFIGYNWVPLPLPLVREYEWWTKGEHIPLLKIITREVQGQETITSIEYRDKYLGLTAGIEEKTISLEMYPVPCKDELMVRCDRKVDKLEIVDQLGRTVNILSTENSYLYNLDTRTLAPGVYEMRIFADGIQSSKKFIKQ